MMALCAKCFENNWKYRFIDGWIIATCQACGHEVEFQSRREKKIAAGKPIGSGISASFITDNGVLKRLDGKSYRPVGLVLGKKGKTVGFVDNSA